jgi:hypothetical protein
MSNEEHVLSIEIHHGSLIVITIDSDTNDFVHSIVLDTEVPTAKFNIEGLLDTNKEHTVRVNSRESEVHSVVSRRRNTSAASKFPPATNKSSAVPSNVPSNASVKGKAALQHKRGPLEQRIEREYANAGGRVSNTHTSKAKDDHSEFHWW